MGRPAGLRLCVHPRDAPPEDPQLLETLGGGGVFPRRDVGLLHASPQPGGGWGGTNLGLNERGTPSGHTAVPDGHGHCRRGHGAARDCLPRGGSAVRGAVADAQSGVECAREAGTPAADGGRPHRMGAQSAAARRV